MRDDRPAKILLVDDDALIVMATRAALQDFGYKVLIASSGEKAIEIFRAAPDIDPILMDIDLGQGLDGTEAAAVIMAGRDLPVVFLSSHSEPEVVDKTEKIASYGYVVKNTGDMILDVSIRMAWKLFRAKKEEESKEALLRQALESLQASEIRLRTILDNMPIGFAANTIDDGVARYHNRRFEETYGWPREILADVDSFFSHVYQAADWEKTKASALADAASGDPRRMSWEDIPITTQSGERRFVSAKDIPLPEQNLMVSTVWDTTRIYKSLQVLRESEARFRSVFDASSEAILLTTPDGRILNANPAACRLFGWTEEELRRAVREAVVDPADPRLAPALEERDRTGRFHGRLTFIRKDGRTKAAVALPPGEKSG